MRKPIREQELGRVATYAPTLDRPEKVARVVPLSESGSFTAALVSTGTGPQTLAPTIAPASNQETGADSISEGTNQASKPKSTLSAPCSLFILPIEQ